MRFGIIASHQYPFEENLRQRLSELFRLVELAAELGYHSVWPYNHFLSNLQVPQVITMVSTILRYSGDMTVGTGVLLLPLFHPVHIAEEFATLDQISGGRVVLGVGIGYRDHEYEAFGIRRSQGAARLEEAVTLIRALWSGETVNHDGPFYPLRGQRIGIPPLTPGGPPLWIGAGARAAVQRAARLGDAWLAPGNSPDPTYLHKAVGWYCDALAESGRSLAGRERPVMIELYCGPDRERAVAEVRPYIAREYDYYAHYEALRWQRDRFDALMEHTFVIGSPDDVAARIAALRDLGFNHIIFRPFWTGMPAELALRSVRLVAEEVMPRFAAPPPAESTPLKE
jgi:alkanesulfonate monooxygenase SsuD/methylene tetrahydromethanopterin reductase-like flavin-dependent oxidoreductase (luciferase family)